MSNSSLYLFGCPPPFDEVEDKVSWSQLASVCGFDEDAQEQLFLLLTVVNAPADLHGLEVALEMFAQLLPHIEENKGVTKKRVSEWNNLISLIISMLEKLKLKQLQELMLGNIKNYNARGVLKKHPWYGLLLFAAQLEDRDAVLSYVARFTKTIWERGGKDSSSVRYNLTLIFRKIFGEMNFQTLLPDNPSELSDDELSEFFMEIQASEDSVSVVNKRFIIEYFNGSIQARGRQYRRRRHVNTNNYGIRGFPRKFRRTKANVLETERQGLVDAEYQGIPIHLQEVVTAYHAGGEKAKIRESGLYEKDCVVDHYEIQEIISDDTPVSVAVDSRRKRFIKKNISDQISLNSQPLPFRWSKLETFEIWAMLESLPKLEKINPELVVILLICFLKGVSVKEALTVKTFSKKKFGRTAYFEYVEKNLCNWWLPEYIGLNLGRGTLGCIDFGEKKQTHFKVVIPPGFSDLLVESLQKIPDWDTRRGHLIELRRLSKIKKDIAKWLSSVNRKYKTRLTLLRVCRYFPEHATYFNYMDSTIVAYIRGKFELNSETQIYYTRTTSEAINKAYAYYCYETLSNIHKEWKTSTGDCPRWLVSGIKHYQTDLSLVGRVNLQESIKHGIGAKKVPHTDEVRSMVRCIKSSVEESKKQFPIFERTIEHHNQYMLYTLMYLTWASGYRAVSSPLPDIRLLDLETGLLAISDKDSEDGYCTRFVWLTDGCVQQIVNYLKHLRALCNRLAIYNRDHFEIFISAFNNWDSSVANLKTKRWGKGENDYVFSPFVYFEKGRLKQIRPKAIRNLLPENYKLPLDSNRHYIRTYFLDNNFDHALLDAMMGHWHQGSEPWSKTSTLSPIQLKKEIRPFMTQIMEELGFHPIKSIEV